MTELSPIPFGLETAEPPAHHPFAPEHTLVLRNVKAGTALGKNRARQLMAGLRERGYRVDHPVAPDQATAAIIIGGDGTLYETIARLPARVRIAYFPGGTANMFGLNWQLPRSPAAWLALLDAGRTQPVRLGLANSRPFASVASVGFDAMLVHRTRYPLKQLLSQGAYALEFIPAYLTYAVPRIRLTVDGRPWPEPDVLSVIVGRGPHYAGAYHVLPADPRRPELAFAVIPGRAKWEIGKFAVGLLFDQLSRMQGVHCGTARDIIVEADPPACVQLDGDPCGTTPVRFAVEPHDRIILA